MDYKSKSSQVQHREISVFISSTFRDLQEEREELVKRVFPQLRHLCEERGVVWREVDLRWGVTEARAERGEVLPVCLAEIKRCRPHFIGILAERYGSVPKHIPETLLSDEKWLEDDRTRSLTELEIMYGVLEDPTMADRARFYFRDPAYVESVPSERHADYIEADPEAREKLAQLKDRIRKSGLPVREDYADPQALGKLVLQDLTEVINQEYPLDEAPDPLDREALEHEMFAESRRAVYIGRTEYFDRLDKHASENTDGPGLVVLGESGSGKSALLANWISRYREEQEDDLVIMHFIGATPYSTDWAAMCRRIMGELKRRFDIGQDIPDKPDELRLAFANWLHMAAAKGRVVLVLDALNQLEDRDQAPDLVWLPPVMPGNVRLIVTTLSDRPLDELMRRGWPSLRIESLNEEERGRYIVDYLKILYGKELDDIHVTRIAKTRHTSNPLYLKALLEELRIFGIYEQLDERIEHYLLARTVDDLYERILERYELDYERDQSGLVSDSMSLIWASRRGLYENELLELLGKPQKPLPHAYWSPFFLAAQGSLVNRSGLIGYFHDYLRQAVEDRYLVTEDEQRSMHLRLASYFDNLEFNSRKVDELPWQLSMAKRWDRLYELLSDLQFLDNAWTINQFEIKGYWAQIEANSSYRMIEAYRAIINNPAEHIEHAWTVSNLLDNFGHLLESLRLDEQLVDYYKRIGDTGNMAVAMCNMANILYSLGNYGKALEIYKIAEKIYHELGSNEGVQRSLGNQATIHYAIGEHEESMKLYKKQEKICRETNSRDGLQHSIGSQANILASRYEYNNAMKLYKEQENICRVIGNKDGLQYSLEGQASIFHSRKYFDEAMKLYRSKESICREIGSREGLQSSFHGQANVYFSMGEYDKAMRLFKKQENLCRETGYKDGLQSSLQQQAEIHSLRKAYGKAMKLYKEQETICRVLNNKEWLQYSLQGQATIHYSLGEYEQAMKCFKEQEEICRTISNKEWLKYSLHGQANIEYASGNYDVSVRLYREQEQICQDIDDKKGLHQAKQGQANVYYALRQYEKSLRLYKEEENICREIDDMNGVQYSLGNQAIIHFFEKEYDKALVLYKLKERICRDIDNEVELQYSLQGQANIYLDLGEYETAIKYFNEQENLCTKINNLDGIQRALQGLASAYYSLGEHKKALIFLNKQEEICRDTDNKDGLQRSLHTQAIIYSSQGNDEKAIKLFQQQEGICRIIQDSEGLLRSLKGLANIYYSKSQYEPAMKLYAKCEQLSIEIDDPSEMQYAIGQQAKILSARGDHETALFILNKQEKACRKLDNITWLATCLANKAVASFNMGGDPSSAITLADEAYELAKSLDDKGLVSNIELIIDAIKRHKRTRGALSD